MTIITRFAAAALGLSLLAGATIPALASGDEPSPTRQTWSFAGPFGTYDRAQLQRGFKVYKEVCVACHSMGLLAFRNLSQPGGPEFSTDEVQQLTADWVLQVKDLDDQGNVKERQPRPADRFPAPFANEAQGRAANNGAYPPDLSVMAKARTFERGFPWWVTDIFTQYNENGVDYIVSLLTGYEDAPEGFKVPDGSFYNRYFPGHVLAMTPPLSDGQVDYTDGTPATLQNYAKDVAAFLMWTAEPHLEQRKRIGLQVLLFLVVFAGLLYFTKKRIWADVH